MTRNVRLKREKRAEFIRIFCRLIRRRDGTQAEQDAFFGKVLRVSARQVQRYRSAEANMSAETYQRLLAKLPQKYWSFLDTRLFQRSDGAQESA